MVCDDFSHMTKRGCTLLLLVSVTSLAYGQRIITTIAGNDVLFPSGPLAALDAPLGEVFGVTIDKAGGYYVCDRQNHVVVRIDPKGDLRVIAGNGLRGF